MSDLKMPERKHDDGPVGVNRPREGYVSIGVVTDGQEQRIVMGEHNAWRVFGPLAFALGIPLGTAAGEAIKF